jgi:hypothetical protein
MSTTEPKCIYWIRHAESCANLLENKIVDTYTNSEWKSRHFDHFQKQASTPQNFDADSATNQLTIKDTPDMEDPAIRSIVEKNIGKINANTACNKKIFVGGPESRWLFHPPLSAVGIMQAQKLHASPAFEAVVNQCNVFITSATVRTIMTAIYSLLHYSKPITLYLVPCINEKLNEASCIGLDYVNIGIPNDKIDEIVEFVIQYVDKTSRNHVIGNITIDTNFYKNNQFHPNTTTLNPDDLLKTSMQTFKNKILPQLSIETAIPIPEMTMLAYTHGYVINDLLKYYKSDYATKNPYAPNVSMFKEMGNQMDVVIVDREAANGGVFIRKNSPTFIDADIVDSNPCNLRGFRGNINKILHSSISFRGGNLRKKSQKRRNSKKNKKVMTRPKMSRNLIKKYKSKQIKSKKILLI